MYKYAVNIKSAPEIIERGNLMIERIRSIIKFPDSARNRNPEEYKGTVFYRFTVLLYSWLRSIILAPPEKGCLAWNS